VKPHLAHISNTLIKKQLACMAGNEQTAYAKYKNKVDFALAAKVKESEIIEELNREIETIEADKRDGDPIFQEGIHNAKTACISAIRLLISELKGDNDVLHE
jgi:hypothetical protein